MQRVAEAAMQVMGTAGKHQVNGADTGFTHFIGGMDFDVNKIQKQLVIGKTRLKAVWKDKKEGNIFDLDYFKPI
jgi:hypothetical protein